MSRRDRTILAVIGTVIVYGATACAWFMGVSDSWANSEKAYKNAYTKRRKESALIAKKASFKAEYEAEREKMPVFPEGKSTDTYWLDWMDRIAGENHIVIAQRQGGKEEAVGDVKEQPIEVKGWEGALESLVKFLYALQTAEGAMFDVRDLVIRPSSGHKGYLKGSFTLTCAYMRNAPVETESPKKAKVK